MPGEARIADARWRHVVQVANTTELVAQRQPDQALNVLLVIAYNPAALTDSVVQVRDGDNVISRQSVPASRSVILLSGSGVGLPFTDNLNVRSAETGVEVTAWTVT